MIHPALAIQMNRLRLLVSLLSLLACVAASPALWAQESTQDERGVRQLIESFSETWNKTHNPKSMASYWTEDGDLINPWGKQATNRREVEQVFTFEQNGPLKGSILQQNIEKIRFLSPDIALVDAAATMVNALQDQTILDHHVVFIVVKHGGKWFIASARPYVFMTHQIKKQNR